MTRAVTALTLAAALWSAPALQSQTSASAKAPADKSADRRAPYELVPDWGQLPDGAQWGQVPGMAIDKSGRIFAFRRGEPPIVELDRDGQVLKMWGEKLFVWPHGIRVDASGALWVTDGRARDGRGQQIFKYSTDRKLLMTIGTAGVSGDSRTTFNGPCDVAVAANGDVFIADGHVNARVVKYSKDGTFIKTWGKKGTAPGEFNVPHAIVIDSRGRVLVGDRSNKRIQIFDQDGTFIDQWTHLGSPSGMFISSDDTLYVVDYNDKKGVLIASAKDGSLRYKLDEAVAEGVAVDADGSIYVGETVPETTLAGQPGGNRVRKLLRLK